MIGQKHLIECHCSLSIYRNKNDIVYHRFSVYSKLDKKNKVIPKYSKCNNCGANHYVYEFCKSEIKNGKEDSDLSLSIEDIKISLPEKIVKILEQYDCDISIYEEIDHMYDLSYFPHNVVIKREIIDDEHTVKILSFEKNDRFKILTEKIGTIIKEWIVDKNLKKIVENRKVSREIVKEILNFGVNEQQKLDVMFELALNLENNIALKEITTVIKKFREKINKEEEEDNIINEASTKPRLIID